MTERDTYAQKLKSLTPLQFDVTQNGATEPKFRNAFWDHYQEGVYVDIVSGEPLFLSSDKIRSRSGWPAFSKPVSPSAIEIRDDFSSGSRRREVRSAKAGSHLGHVFRDGQTGLSTTGQWYCINSAALNFVPTSQMAEAGYGYLLHVFNMRETETGYAL